MPLFHADDARLSRALRCRHTPPLAAIDAPASMMLRHVCHADGAYYYYFAARALKCSEKRVRYRRHAHSCCFIMLRAIMRAEHTPNIVEQPHIIITLSSCYIHICCFTLFYDNHTLLFHHAADMLLRTFSPLSSSPLALICRHYF